MGLLSRFPPTNFEWCAERTVRAHGGSFVSNRRSDGVRRDNATGFLVRIYISPDSFSVGSMEFEVDTDT